MDKHTPGTWTVGTCGYKVGVWGKAGDCIAVCDGCSLGADTNAYNAARIVACVNSLAGLNPDAVPGLVSALRRVAALNENAGEIGAGMLMTIVTEARAALAKAEVGQ